MFFRRRHGKTTGRVDVHHHFKGQEFAQREHGCKMAIVQQVTHIHLGIGRIWSDPG